MRLDQDNLTGIRVIDDEGKYLLDYSWEDEGDWTEQWIPDGQSIIGLMVN